MSDDQTRRPRGRRDNGLQARSYLPLSDVDPRVGEHLLDVLYLAGIAAYLRPSMDTDVVTRAASLPSQPSDRIWVDRTRLLDARRLLTAEAAESGRSEDAAGRSEPRPGRRTYGTAKDSTAPDRGTSPAAPSAGSDGTDAPGGDGVDYDSVFASIVAGYDTPHADPVSRWSVAEDIDDEDEVADDRVADDRVADDRVADDEVAGDQHDDAVGPLPADTFPAAGAQSAAGPRDWQPGDDPDDERFVPPPPPPLPHVSRGTGAALAIMAIGVLLFLFPGLLDLSGDLALAVPIGAIVVGVVILVWRMYDGPPIDDGPDDGAVV